MAYSFKYQLLRLRFSLIVSGAKRSRWVSEKNIFSSVGKNVYFQPRILPADPELIRLHNNISIASGVTFITHDVFRLVLNNLELSTRFKKKIGCIEIMDNVLVGSEVIILPNVRIGPNAIVGAGSVVTKDVPPGKIVAGNPARVIGDFDEFVNKRIKEEIKNISEESWEIFYRQRE